jgi:hypothetical protein
VTGTAIDPKEAARNTRKALRQDGLDLIVGGLGLALIAIFFLDIRHGWAYVIAVGLHASLLPFLRRRVVYPRIGYAKLPAMKMTFLYHMLVIIGVGIALILFYVLGKESRFNWIMPLYVGIVLSFIAFVTALRYKLTIDYAIACIFLVSGIIGISLTRTGHPAGLVTAVQLWILAAVLVPIGSVQFIVFMHKQPLAEEHQ